MFLAAAGYITYCYVTIFQVGERTFGKDSVFGTNTIVILAIVFLAAAKWMPSLIAFIRSGEGHWWVVCLVSLWVTTISLLLTTGVTAISPVDGISKMTINASVGGLAYTTFHCLFLDAMVWVSRCTTNSTLGYPYGSANCVHCSGSIFTPPAYISQCRCGPVTRPVAPILPMCCPANTASPTLT